MSKETLRAQLQELHAELQQVKSVDLNEREMLRNLATDVQKILSSEDERIQESSIGDQLKEAIAQVEASHPRATMLMRQVIDELSYLGI